MLRHPAPCAIAAALAAALALPAAASGATTVQPPVTVAAGTPGAPVAALATTAAGGDGTLGIVASAGAGWQARFAPPGQPLGPPQALGPATHDMWGEPPDLAIDDAGNAIAVWLAAGRDLMWAYRPAGGTFGPAQALGQAAYFVDPRVAVLSDGTALLVWRAMNRQIQVAHRPPGAATTFTQVDALSAVPGERESTGGEVTLAVAPDDSVAVAWMGQGRPTLQVAVRRAGQAQFEPAQTIATPPANPFTVPMLPDLAFRPDGGVDAVWLEQATESHLDGGAVTPRTTGAIFAASRGPGAGAAWSAPVRLVSGGPFLSLTPLGGPQLAVHPSGAATVAWTDTAAEGPGATTWVTRGAGAPFAPSAGASVPAPGQMRQHRHPVVGALCDGSTLTAWDTEAGVSVGVQSGAEPPLALGAYPTIAGGEDTLSLAMAPGGGRALVAWSAVGWPQSRVEAAFVETTAGSGYAPSAPAPASGYDESAPVLSRVRLSRARLGAGGRGTTLSWRTNERGRVLVGIERRTARGWTSAERCVTALPGAAATLATVQGKVHRRVAKGTGTYAFSGRIGGRALAPGRYRFRLVAVDARGNRSRARTVRFTVGR